MKHSEEKSDESTSSGRRSRRFRVFGCLVVAAAVLALSLLATASGNPDDSAWDRMPASTIAAVEIRGLSEIMFAAISDGWLDVVSAALPPGGTDLFERGRAFTDALMWSPRFVRAAVVPESMTFGTASGYGGDAMPFAIIRMPAWANLARWCAMREEDGRILEYAAGGKAALYYSFVEGWCVLSPSRNLAEDILADWTNSRHRLGEKPNSPSPYVAAALLAGGRRSTRPHPAAPVPDNPFLSGQAPFDALSRPTSDGGARWRALLRPRADAWEIQGSRDGLTSEDADGSSVSDAMTLPPLFPGSKGRDLGLEFAVILPPRRDGDGGVSLPEYFERPDPATSHPLRSLGWLWMEQGLLRHATGDFIFRVSGPPGGEGIATRHPLLPVFSLTWRTDGDRTAAKRNFNEAAALFFDSLTSPGGFLALRALRASAKPRPFDDANGRGMMVHLPPVVAYGAKPGWMFVDSRGGSENHGVVFSDPMGLIFESGSDPFAWPAFNADRPAGVFTVSGSWNLGESLRENSLHIAREVVAAAQRAGMAKNLSFIMGDWAEKTLGLCRRGNLAASYASDAGRCRFTISLARGMPAQAQ